MWDVKCLVRQPACCAAHTLDTPLRGMCGAVRCGAGCASGTRAVSSKQANLQTNGRAPTLDMECGVSQVGPRLDSQKLETWPSVERISMERNAKRERKRLVVEEGKEASHLPILKGLTKLGWL